jgi:hypothetical protein
VQISNISGSESHLNKIKEIAEIAGKSCDYLYIGFEGQETDHNFSDVLAKAYVEVFRKFEKISILRFEVIDDSNLTKIL